MNEVKCPKCGSNQITANKKGFSGTKAVAGAVLTGGVGLLAGTIGSNKVVITCLNCGNQFRPGQTAKPRPAFNPNSSNVNSNGARFLSLFLAFVCGLLSFIMVIVVFNSEKNERGGASGALIFFVLLTLILVGIAKNSKKKKQ